MAKMEIPFNRPFIIGKELYYIARAIMSGHSAGDGTFTKKCQSLMEEKFQALKVLLTTSCTTALEMAAILCDVGPDDEVILPSFTFVSTANAFYRQGAKLSFVDICPNTLNIDESKIEEVITERTKVIVPVHYAGVGCEMDKIMELARKYNLYVVEDAAQGVNTKHNDKYLGTIGDIGAFSFHETKNYICGEGGAIVVNNKKFIERAEIIREKGTDRSKFFRGEVDKYTWMDIGSSFLPSDILAAFLYAQLEHMDVIDSQRNKIFKHYHKNLTPLAEDGLIRLPKLFEEESLNNHLFYIILKDEDTRNNLMNHLRSKGITAVFHYLPLHLSPVGRSLGNWKLPVTESISGRLLRLPLFYELKSNEQDKVISGIRAFFGLP